MDPWSWRLTGTSALRNFGTSELRNFGTSELRNFGTSELRNVGTSERRNFGTSERRNVGTCQSPPSWGHRSPRSWDQVEAVNYRPRDRMRGGRSRGPRGEAGGHLVRGVSRRRPIVGTFLTGAEGGGSA